ncbi:MAG: DUF5107 domain-containing protein, partial [Cyclobacteriaceae bacterium]
HAENFGMARYSLRDEKAGKKIWIWGLSQQGMIWEKLLSDTDGQYVEIQSGRAFNQAADDSNSTPFKQLGFSPYSSDEWTEYWFPVKGTKGFVKANPYGALNLRQSKEYLKINFSPLQNINGEFKILEGEKLIYTKNVNLKTLNSFADSIAFQGDFNKITVTLGSTIMQYKTDPNDGLMRRPVKSPENFDWNSVSGLYTQGKEFIQQRYYPQAEEKLKAALEKDPNYLPALTDLSMVAYRNMDYEKSLALATHALSLDTYDPAANFYYGLANAKSGNITDAKDGFDIASISGSFRGAAYTELSKLYAGEQDYSTAVHYANKSVEVNSGNSDAYQLLALIHRINNEKEKALASLDKLKELTPLNHFIRYEKYRLEPSESSKAEFTENIRNEMPHETYLQLADWYLSVGQPKESIEILSLAPENPEVFYWMAYLNHKNQNGQATAYIEKANNLSPQLIFPFRSTSAEVLNWAVTQTQNWKPKYYLALIHWSRNDTVRAKALFSQCGEPDFPPFYAARAKLNQNDNYSGDLKQAASLDPNQWRYGKLLTDHYIEKQDYPKALATATEYHKRFPKDFRLNMLLAKTLLLNKQYKSTTDLLSQTTILPYEGATDGRQLYHESWLMQAISQTQATNYKAALASVSKARLWPANLGAGKPYEEDIDSRLENYMEAVIFRKTKDKEKAKNKLAEVARDPTTERHTINDLLTALALKQSNRENEGEKLLKGWLEKQPKNKMAQWAYEVYHGNVSDIPGEADENWRILKEVVKLDD